MSCFLFSEQVVIVGVFLFNKYLSSRLKIWRMHVNWHFCDHNCWVTPINNDQWTTVHVSCLGCQPDMMYQSSWNIFPNYWDFFWVCNFSVLKNIIYLIVSLYLWWTVSQKKKKKLKKYKTLDLGGFIYNGNFPQNDNWGKFCVKTIYYFSNFLIYHYLIFNAMLAIEIYW